MPSGPERLAQGFLEVDRASAHPCCHLNCQSPKPGRGVNGQAGREQSTDRRTAGCQPCPTDRRSRHTQSEVDLTFQSPLPGLWECFSFPGDPPAQGVWSRVLLAGCPFSSPTWQPPSCRLQRCPSPLLSLPRWELQALPKHY